MFSPFAFAADPTPSPTSKPTSTIPYPAEIKSGGSCTVSTISDSERETLWANTAAKPIQQLTDVPLEVALNQQGAKITNPLDPNAPLNPAPALTVLDQQVTLASLQAFGVPKEKLLKYVQDYDASQDNADEVLQNTAVTVSQANEIMRRELSRGSSALERWNQVFNNFLGGNREIPTVQPLPQGTPEPYANLKVIIPGPVGENGKQREITYAQVAAAQALNPDSCLLKGTIKGRISYLGVLGSDLTYGIPGNQTISGKYIYPPTNETNADLDDPLSNQWFVGRSIISSLSLNGGANILLPSFYEDWMAFTGAWSRADLYVSLGISLGATSMINRIEKIRKTNIELKQNLEQARLQSKGFQDKSLTDLYGPIEQRAGAQVFTNTNGDEVLVRTVHLRDEPLLDAAGNPVLDVHGNPIIRPVQAVEVRDTGGALVVREEIGAGQTIDSVLSTHNLNPKRVEREGLEYQIRRSEPVKAAWERAKKQSVPRVSYNLMMGAAWMGPARLAYDMATRNLFAATGFNENKYLKIMVNRPVAEKFRDATNLFGIGKVQELISEYTGGAPSKAFFAGKVFIGNFPSSSESGDSLTSIGSDTGWKINTVWKGNSFAVNFEDVRYPGAEKYTGLHLVSNEILPRPVLNKKFDSATYNFLLTLALPFLIFRSLSAEAGQTLGLAGSLLVAEEVLNIDANFGKGIECSKDIQDELKAKYRTAVLTDYALTLATSYLPLLRTASQFWRNIYTGAAAVGDVTSWIDPLLAWQWYIGNQAQIYTANCRDSQYKILAYQRLPEATNRANQTASQKASNVLQDVSQSFANTFGSEGDKVQNELAKYTEVLNLKTQLQDQQGFVQPDEIVAVHVDRSAWMVPGGIFDTLNGTGCNLEETLPTADGGALVISKNGLKKINKDGSVAFDFNDFYWKLRASSILRSQELARMIVPNHIITTLLDCGDKPFISISASGSAALADKTCPAANCFESELKKLVEFDGTNLEKVFGKISSVDTTLGTASFTGDSITFTRTSLGEAGVATRAPTLEQAAKTAGLGASTAGVSLTVLGNGSVTLSSPRDFGVEEIGILKTIIGEKGKIEYDPVVKRLYVFVYVIGDGKAQTISDVIAKGGTVNSNGKIIPVVNLDLRGKTGFEDVVKQLRDALAKIQQDSQGGKGGMQILETPDKIYKFNPDGTLTITDKKTGATETFKITGQPFTDANGNVVFPTDKGNISFGTGLNAQGQPIINVNGPGFKDSGLLEAAKGPGGIFTFNPSTGAITVYNGQDLPMDPRFASQGMSFIGTPEGTRGVPGTNPFALPPADDGSFQRRRQNLLLPSWPADALWFAAMMGVLLAGVLFVRTRRFEA
ncbi:MAG: hypothetical protein QXR53_03320 [Candidatus Norongarragalinales archaeon]